MFVGAGIDEFARHADFVAGTAYAALEQIGDIELGPDLPRRLRGGTIPQHRGPRNHAQLGDEREIGENILVHAVGEKGAGVRLVAHVGERKNGDGFTRGRSGRFG
jgi:hypothetical protein